MSPGRAKGRNGEPAPSERQALTEESTPMTITAKFASFCPLCRNRIEVGTSVNWERGSKATHVDCPPAAAPTAPAAPRLSVEDAGVYVTADGTIVKMKANKDKTRVYPMLWREIPTIERLTEADTRKRGEYAYLEDWQERKALLASVEASG